MLKKHFDQHIHSSFSFDAEPEAFMDRMIRAAAEKGFAGVAITDHLDPLWPDDECPSTLDVPEYEAALDKAGRSPGDRIQVAKGVELGFIPGEALEICRAVVSAWPYDFVIGSVHSSATMPVDKPLFAEGRPMRDVIDEYYTILLESVRVFNDYDVLGHLNYIDRYTDGFAPESLYMPYADEIMKITIAGGKGIEINTSAFRYDIGGRGTPTMAILRRFRELGGEIVTIGSDAHRIGDVGALVEDGEEMLLAAGFRYMAVYMERRPEFIKL